jgi:hypothetical protein
MWGLLYSPGSFWRIAGGTASNDPLAPAAPVLTWDTGATDNTPTFTAVFDDTLVHAVPDPGVDEDIIELNYDTDSGFGSPDSATNALDAGEIIAGEVAFTTGALADGTWYARVRHNHVVAGVDHFSPWSNTVSQTIDATAPTVSTYSPADNATDVAVNATLVATFNENITLGTAGTITLKKTSDNTTVDSWDVATDSGSGAGQVEVVSNTQLTLHLTTDIANSLECYVVWDAGVVKDTAGNNVAALSTTTTWSFTTVAGAAWLPSDMFAGGAKWVWYDIQDLDTLWADSSATTPASVDGIVRRVDDKSGNGWNAVAPSDAASPTLRQSGAVYYLEYDGTADNLALSGGGLTVFQNVGVGCIGIAARTGGNNSRSAVYFTVNGASTVRAGLFYDTATGFRMSARRADGDGASSINEGEANTADAAVVGYFDWTNSNGELFIDGVSEGSSTSFTSGDANTSNTASQEAGVGYSSSTWDGRIYQVVAGVPNTTDMSDLSDYLLASMGL